MVGWITCTAPRENPKLRLICFPHAGASGYEFLKWSKRLADDNVEVHFITPPGRGQRIGDALVDDMGDVVDCIVGEIKILLDTPLVFFGHSLGSLVAYETTCKLRELGYPLPWLLAVSSEAAPSVHHISEDEWVHTLPDHNFLVRRRSLFLCNATPQPTLIPTVCVGKGGWLWVGGGGVVGP